MELIFPLDSHFSAIKPEIEFSLMGWLSRTVHDSGVVFEIGLFKGLGLVPEAFSLCFVSG